MTFSDRILKSNNKSKTTWGIVNELTGKQQLTHEILKLDIDSNHLTNQHNPYPTAFPYGNGMVLHFYQQQESSTTKTVHKVINKGLKTYV